MGKKNGSRSGLADPTQLKPRDSNNKQMLRVVIETPKGSRNKFAFDPDEHIFELKKVLPAGMTFGLTRSPVREIVQISSDGFKLGTAAMHNIVNSIPEFRMTLTRYAVVQGMQVAQTVACNRLHRIEQRLARWLLMAQDRVDSGLVAMTHDFFATMLGTNRPTVSSAAAILQKRKAIEYTRGGVRIVNRKKLEASTCECYGVIQQFNSELGLK